MVGREEAVRAYSRALEEVRRPALGFLSVSS